ncbi:MAG: trk system potassium uptake protein TrkH [Planctomycetaceae bacterium]|jgi:trk system potassium uptake protein TrkH
MSPERTPSFGRSSNRQIEERLRSILERLTRIATPAFFVGLVSTVLQHGVSSDTVLWEFGLLACSAMLVRATIVSLKVYLSDDRLTFFRSNRRACIFAGAWLVGSIVLLLFGPVLPVWYESSRGAALVAWSEMFLLLIGLAQLLKFVSRTTSRSNPAMIFVVSFVGLILVGTLLLLLPGSVTEKADGVSWIERCRIALFTATSASCVTGLVVVPTGGPDAWWSRFGQVVIMILFQIGGLGIMSLSATFALLMGNRIAFRESAAVTEVSEASTVRDVRQLLIAILSFTLAAEAIGAVLLSTLWSDLPLGERAFYGTFHAISAFCNAGFSLTGESFLGLGTRWQVWGVVCGLIVVGSLGFGTLRSVWTTMRLSWQSSRQPSSLFRHRRLREQLPLSPRLILTTTAILLLGGAFVYGLLESVGDQSDDPIGTRVADAWFQSVTFRTAGFNTVDHGELNPSTKLFSIGLMFIGASPGSTGGGVKTVALAIIVLALVSILRGRNHVECYGRMIPDTQVRYAFVIVAMGLGATMTSTLLLTVFEADAFAFIDILYEATSAFATVGVSTGITSELTPASQLVVTATMFLGRVGPLTLLLALAGTGQTVDQYQYPLERVSLG